MPHTTLDSPATRRRLGRQRRQRRCLSCSQWFISSGIGEQLCGLCKSSEDWADAMAACHEHIAR
jgi:hypothetical protein